MSLRSQLKHHVRQLAKDLRSGRETDRARRAGEFLAHNPVSILRLVDLILRETGRRNPDIAFIAACEDMFSTGLRLAAYEIEGGDEEAVLLVDELRVVILDLVEDEEMPAEVLRLLLNAFVEAGLAPGPHLTDLFGEMALEAAEDMPPVDPEEFTETLAGLVEQAGGDPFEVYGALAEASKALPAQMRLAMMSGLVAAPEPVVRDAAVHYLLDPASEVRLAACEELRRIASPSLVSPNALRRMITVRNWLQDDEQPALDAAIGKARREQVECAAWPQPTVKELLASTIDGAGAQAVFAVVKDGRRHALAGFLAKEEIGVADAWCLRGLLKPELEEYLDNICWETSSAPVDMDFVRTLVQHHVAISRRSGAVPMAGFLEFIECVGIRDWQPAEITADELLARLEREAGSSRVSDDAVARVLGGDDDWFYDAEYAMSWIEDDAQTRKALSRVRRSGTDARIDAVVESVLEPRRAKWATRFLWTALWLRQAPGLLAPWEEFLVVGRELHKGRPLKEIPVMRIIAEETVLEVEGPSA